MRSRVAMAAVALCLLAACSGDDDAGGTTTTGTTIAPTTTEAPADVSTTTTTTVVTPPTVVTTIVADETTTSTTTEVPTTDPTTTADPDDYAAQAMVIFEQIEGGWETSVLLARDPFNDELRAQLDEYFTGGQLEGRRNVNDRYRAENLYEVENPEDPDSIDIDPASFAMNETQTFATVQACEVTSGIVFEVGGNPDGTDKLIEDGVGRVVVAFEVLRVDGAWKVESGRPPEEADRIASCA